VGKSRQRTSTTVEKIAVNALGGPDTITVNDLEGTDVTEVNMNLAAVLNGNTEGDVSVLGPRRRKSQLLIQGNKMSNLTSFIVLTGLLFFPGPAPANEAEPTAALCARRGLQALREAQQEMTVRDIAAATGIKESTLRQLLKGLAKEGEIRRGGSGEIDIQDGAPRTQE
jgi:hypothetical protein